MDIFTPSSQCWLVLHVIAVPEATVGSLDNTVRVRFERRPRYSDPFAKFRTSVCGRSSEDSFNMIAAGVLEGGRITEGNPLREGVYFKQVYEVH
jgi:hypothetical protein